MAITLIDDAVIAGARCVKACEIIGLSERTLRRPVCQPKHEPTDFEITYKSGCLGERNAKANHSS